jgi:hypothetical protein
MKKVTLYTKLDCYLCDEGYQMLLDVACDIPLKIEVVDITHEHNKNIKPLYAERIPVLTNPNTKTELDWPFTPKDIKAYLNPNRSDS